MYVYTILLFFLIINMWFSTFKVKKIHLIIIELFVRNNFPVSSNFLFFQGENQTTARIGTGTPEIRLGAPDAPPLRDPPLPPARGAQRLPPAPHVPLLPHAARRGATIGGPPPPFLIVAMIYFFSQILSGRNQI